MDRKGKNTLYKKYKEYSISNLTYKRNYYVPKNKMDRKGKNNNTIRGKRENILLALQKKQNKVKFVYDYYQSTRYFQTFLIKRSYRVPEIKKSQKAKTNPTEDIHNTLWDSNKKISK